MGMMNKKFQGALALAVVLATSAGMAQAEIFDLGGDVTFGDENEVGVDIGSLLVDPGPGLPQYNRMMTSGNLVFGGLLNVVLTNDFAPASGNSFDVFDWGSTAGSFATIDVSKAALAPGLSWDTSKLYTTGEIMVTGTALPPAVPEPAGLALMLAGIGVIGFKLRRQRARTVA